MVICTLCAALAQLYAGEESEHRELAMKSDRTLWAYGAFLTCYALSWDASVVR